MTTNNKQTIIDRLLKVKELAVRGVDGEQAAAKKLLEETMRKYGITEEDLGGGSVRTLYYTTISADEYSLLWYLFKRVWYEYHIDFIDDRYDVVTITSSSIGFKLSVEEHAELSALYEHYRAGLARSVEKLEQNYRDTLDEIKTDLANWKKEYLAHVKRRTEERKKLRKDYRKAREIIAIAYITKNKLHLNNQPPAPLKLVHPENKPVKKKTARGYKTDYAYLDIACDNAENSGDPNQLPALRIGEEEP